MHAVSWLDSASRQDWIVVEFGGQTTYIPDGRVNVPGASQSVETKTWIFDEKDIRHLHEAVPGKVFVTCHDGQEHAGKTVVQVSGQAADLDQVQAHVRLHKLGSHLLELTATDNTGRQLVTQVFVDGSVPLETIESTKSRSFVMEDGTLDKNTAISKAGAGTIYINLTKDLSLEELTLAIHGSGVIEWISPRLAVSKQLAAVVDGSGRVNIHASHNLQAGTLHNSMTGSGSVLYDAANLISADVVSSVVGSGSIRHLQVGKAGNLTLSVTGSGMIASSALSATNSYSFPKLGVPLSEINRCNPCCAEQGHPWKARRESIVSISKG
ncbi:hypothetical protein AeMF1_017791 [Aphanomyces euteiches]|nr:hypothetical protein AeMF1_017791 [Aphanomyces euteiches]